MAVASVRPATLDDVTEIARIQLATWRTAYRDLLSEAALAALDVDETRRAWETSLDHGDRHHVLVALEGDQTVGFCAAGPATSEDVAGADGSLPEDAATTAVIGILLVEPRWGRRGHGSRLLGEAAERLWSDGATRAVAWVLEGDAASSAFYAGTGWEPDGTLRTLDASGSPLRELRFTGSLRELALGEA